MQQELCHRIAAFRRDVLGHGDERDAQGIELLDDLNQMCQGPRKPVQLPAAYYIDPALTDVGEEPVQRWTAILRTGDAKVDVFHGLPSAACCVFP
jgi:hypothetical protein